MRLYVLGGLIIAFFVVFTFLAISSHWIIEKAIKLLLTIFFIISQYILMLCLEAFFVIITILTPAQGLLLLRTKLRSTFAMISPLDLKRWVPWSNSTRTETKEDRLTLINTDDFEIIQGKILTTRSITSLHLLFHSLRICFGFSGLLFYLTYFDDAICLTNYR